MDLKIVICILICLGGVCEPLVIEDAFTKNATKILHGKEIQKGIESTTIFKNTNIEFDKNPQNFEAAIVEITETKINSESFNLLGVLAVVFYVILILLFFIPVLYFAFVEIPREQIANHLSENVIVQ